jgi:outer membrane lipoprotein-sorting protein
MILLGCGCASRRDLTKEGALTLEDVLSRISARNDAITTLAGYGTITVESPEASNKGAFHVGLKKPDSVLVDLRGPFGIHVGTLLLSRKEFVFYNRMENKVIEGSPDGRTLKSVFRLRLGFDEVLRAFTGEFPMDPVRDSLLGFSVEPDAYVVRSRHAGEDREYRIDGETFIVSSYRVSDGTGNVLLTASTGRFAESSGIAVPKFLRIIFPAEHRSITIAYDDIEVNTTVECSFTPPSEAERIQGQ